MKTRCLQKFNQKIVLKLAIFVVHWTKDNLIKSLVLISRLNGRTEAIKLSVCRFVAGPDAQISYLA